MSESRKATMDPEEYERVVRIRVGSRFDDWSWAKVDAERARKAEVEARYQPDPDDGWLSCWARDQGWHLLSLVEGVLSEPYLTVEEPWHCGAAMKLCHSNRNRQYGSWYWCPSCGLKFGQTVFFNWVDPERKSRRDLGGEGVVVHDTQYRKAIDMGQNGMYFTTRESNRPLHVTAAQMGLGA